jgi:hypothetical protein
MNNTRAWWNDLKVIEGTGTPFEELKALSVPAKFELFVELSCVEGASGIDLNRMVNNQIDWAEWVDLLWITSETLHSIAHSSEIDNSGHTTNKILLVE